MKNALLILTAIVMWLILPVFFGFEWYKATGSMFQPILGENSVLASSLLMRVIGSMVIGIFAGVLFSPARIYASLLVLLITCIQAVYFVIDWEYFNTSTRMLFGYGLLLLPPTFMAAGAYLGNRIAPSKALSRNTSQVIDLQ